MTAPGGPADPLEVARLWAEQSGRIADRYAAMERDDPGLGQVRAHVDGAGKQQFDLEQRASFMALISIAGDLRRIAGAILDDEPARRVDADDATKALAAVLDVIDGPEPIVTRVTKARDLAWQALGRPGPDGPEEFPGGQA